MVRAMVMFLLPNFLSSLIHASVGSDTPMMNLDAASGKACLKWAILMAGLHVPRIALKPLQKSGHALGLPPNLGSAALLRLLCPPSVAEAGLCVSRCPLIQGLGSFETLI